MTWKTWAIILVPGEAPRAEQVDHSLEAYQKIVGGFIEAVDVASDTLAYVNEEGLIYGLEPNEVLSGLVGRVIVGPAVLLGQDADGEETNVPERWLKQLLPTDDYV